MISAIVRRVTPTDSRVKSPRSLTGSRTIFRAVWSINRTLRRQEGVFEYINPVRHNSISDNLLQINKYFSMRFSLSHNYTKKQVY